MANTKENYQNEYCFNFNSKKVEKQSIKKKDYQSKIKHIYILNVLYVALTRASDQMYVFTQYL